MLIPPVSESANSKSVASCQRIHDDLARLVCYDNLFDEPNPENPTVISELKNVNPHDEFGKEHVQPTPVSRVEANLVGYFTGWTGKTVFTLDNGQVWRQVNNGMKNYNPRDPIYEPKITISKGLFGSYKLRVDGVVRIINVKRVK